MNQFGKILKFELKSYFKNKVFVGITIFLVVAIAIVMCFPRILAVIDNELDMDSISDELPVMYVQLEEYAMPTVIYEAFQAAFPDYEVKPIEFDEESVKEEIKSGNVQCAFLLTSLSSYIYYVDNLSMYDTNTAIADEVLGQIYQMNAMVENGMTSEQVHEVMNVQVSGEVVNLGKDQIQNFFYTYIMIFALYMVILLYGQMVATNVATEKSSRAMELLITSAKPTSMMFGKVMASCLAGFIQLAAVFGSALVFYNINKSYWGDNMIIDSIFNIPPELFVYLLIFFILGFLIYAFMFGAVGSTASKLEDINTSVMPITLLFVISFMVVMFSMSSGNVDNVIMKVCSYIPFTSPMAMFTRICMSTVPIYEVLISIVILVASTAGVGVLAAKIYRVGVLMYGTTPKIGAILKSIWKA